MLEIWRETLATLMSRAQPTDSSKAWSNLANLELKLLSDKLYET